MNELIGKLALVTGGSRGIGAATVTRAGRSRRRCRDHLQQLAGRRGSVVKQIEAARPAGFAIQADAADAAAVAEPYGRRTPRWVGSTCSSTTPGVGRSARSTDFARGARPGARGQRPRPCTSPARPLPRVLADGGRMIHLGSSIAERNTGPGMTLYAHDQVGGGRTEQSTGPRTRRPRDHVERRPARPDRHGDEPGRRPVRRGPARAPRPRPRSATPARSPRPIVYLAGPHAAYVTGTELTIDGGHAA